MVYYKHLFLNMEDLSPNEGLVYSELVFNSLVSNERYKTGELLCIDAARDALEFYHYIQTEESIKYYPLDVKELMNRTEMSFPSIKKILSALEEKGYIKEGEILCPLAMIQEGYIKIPKGTKAKGRQLIFYGFLLDRSRRYRGVIDTWAYRFKELCGVDADDAYFMIKQLKKKGLVERLEDNRLKIISPRRRQ